LGLSPGHPLAEEADIARRRRLVAGVVPAAEVDVLGQGRDHILGPQAPRNLVLVAQVESRAAPQALLGDSLPLDFLEARPLDGDPAVLALAPLADLVELGLQLAPAIAIVLLL